MEAQNATNITATIGDTTDLPDTAEGGVYRVDLRAEGEGAPVAIRLRALIKTALRGYSLRCVGIVGQGLLRTDHFPMTNTPNRWRPRRRRTPKEPPCP